MTIPQYSYTGYMIRLLTGSAYNSRKRNRGSQFSANTISVSLFDYIRIPTLPALDGNICEYQNVSSTVTGGQEWSSQLMDYEYYDIPVQIGPEGLGAPFCSYRTASPRCPSYKLAEPNVHRGRFLLQNGSPSWPLVTKWVTDFARLASARIRWLDLPFTEWWGLGVAILALS